MQVKKYIQKYTSKSQSTSINNYNNTDSLTILTHFLQVKGAKNTDLQEEHLIFQCDKLTYRSVN